MARRNPFRPGTAAYAREAKARLGRKAALASARAERAVTPATRAKAKRQAAAARRGLRKIETREEFRAALFKEDRADFDRMSIAQQNREITFADEDVPPDEPDPFAGQGRGTAWGLHYRVRGAIRNQARR